MRIYITWLRISYRTVQILAREDEVQRSSEEELALALACVVGQGSDCNLVTVQYSTRICVTLDITVLKIVILSL